MAGFISSIRLLIGIFCCSNVANGILTTPGPEPQRDLWAYNRDQVADWDRNTVLFDETKFSNKKSFDYHFDDDFTKQPNTDDAYDELVAYLPKFNVVKNGRNLGVTSLPVVTRKVPTWSTPLPRTRKNSYVKFTTPKIEPIFAVTENPVKDNPTLIPISSQRLSERRPEGVNRIPPEQTITFSDTDDNHNFILINQDIPKNRIASRSRFRVQAIKIAPASASGNEKPVIAGGNVKPIQQRVNVQKVSAPLQNRAHQPVLISRVSGDTEIPATGHVNLKSNSFRLHDKASTTTRRPTTIRPTTAVRTRTITTTQQPQITTVPFVETSETTVQTQTTQPHRLPASSPRPHGHPAPKPPLINYPDQPYRGPTFGCPLLNPEKDGRPSAKSSPECRLRTAKHSCTCTYEIDKRDANECVLSFVYTCIKQS